MLGNRYPGDIFVILPGSIISKLNIKQIILINIQVMWARISFTSWFCSAGTPKANSLYCNTAIYLSVGSPCAQTPPPPSRKNKTWVRNKEDAAVLHADDRLIGKII